MTAPRFDWDDANIDHIAQHLVTPDEAVSVLADPKLWWLGIGITNGEWRVELVGEAHTGRILEVVVTPRAGRLRVVSAYRARPGYVRRYLAGR